MDQHGEETNNQPPRVQSTRQTAGMTALTNTTTSLSIRNQAPSEEQVEETKEARWWYRAWSSESQGKLDDQGNMVAGNPDIFLEDLDDIALNFAEYHANKDNRKPTALVSVTYDPFKAIKYAYWKAGSSDRQLKVFITAVFSDNYYMSTDLADKVKREPLRSMLSSATRNRLNGPNIWKSLETEAIFYGYIFENEISHTISLDILIARGLEFLLLPELQVKVGINNAALPHQIRAALRQACGQDSTKIAERYRLLYSRLADGRKVEGLAVLTRAQSMMDYDSMLCREVRDEGHRLFGAEVLSLYNHVKDTERSDK